jgi:ATP-binding cassette subfamily C protein
MTRESAKVVWCCRGGSGNASRSHEPNANLDGESETALHQAIIDLKARRAIVVLIAHRPATLSACDRLLVLANGVQQGFGPRDEILRKVFAHRTAPAAPGNLKVVGNTADRGRQ